jgi:CRISPR system Cascade subunit CasE
MSLHLLSFRPDFDRLARLAARERLLPPGDDLGYAVHAVFAASFGDEAPKPFQIFGPGEPGGGPAGRLLAYSTAPLERLQTRAESFADPAFSNALDLSSTESKIMPTLFPSGTRLGFRVRVRPVQRSGRSPDGSIKARERDVYSESADGATAASARADAYGNWLADQFARNGAATIETGRADAMRRTCLLTRNRSGAVQTTRSVSGPDAIFSGVLVVSGSAEFADLLQRGIGRFRAFGFGMLLLTPP